MIYFTFFAITGDSVAIPYQQSGNPASLTCTGEAPVKNYIVIMNEVKNLP
jgi:hypothetical protein